MSDTDTENAEAEGAVVEYTLSFQHDADVNDDVPEMEEGGE